VKGARRAARALARAPWLTLTLCASALSLHAALSSPLLLAYDPSRPSWLQLLGCHLVHFSPLHLRWDVCTFTLVSAIAERMARSRHALFLLAAACLVPPVACALSPWVTRYAGLSGLVLGQVALLLAGAWRRDRAARWPALLLALLYAKQLYELHIGNTSLVAMDYQGFATVPVAHLISVVLGTMLGALPARRGSADRCLDRHHVALDLEPDGGLGRDPREAEHAGTWRKLGQPGQRGRERILRRQGDALEFLL
jgi:membrane associated rhomboid family serine protease